MREAHHNHRLHHATHPLHLNDPTTANPSQLIRQYGIREKMNDTYGPSQHPWEGFDHKQLHITGVPHNAPHHCLATPTRCTPDMCVSWSGILQASPKSATLATSRSRAWFTPMLQPPPTAVLLLTSCRVSSTLPACRYRGKQYNCQVAEDFGWHWG